MESSREVVKESEESSAEKAKERHSLRERFNIVRIANVKYNGRGKYPKNACSMLTAAAEGLSRVKESIEGCGVKFLDTSIC